MNLLLQINLFPRDIDELQIVNPRAIAWAVSAAVVLIMIAMAGYSRGRAKRRFATADRLDAVFHGPLGGGRSTWVSIASTLSIVAAIVLLSASLMDIRWGKTEREVPQRGIEVMFLLDVSRSMLAEDVAPNRLERAKQMIRDTIEPMAGDRVGLVAFAGETRQVIPLTNHYEDFSQVLSEVGPHTVRRGGSKLGDAIRAGGDAFLEKTDSTRIMVVLTDGEDQESDPVRMAGELRSREGIHVFTIGLGDAVAGSRIPDVDVEQPRQQTTQYVRHQGEPVISKLNGQILSGVAKASDAVYIPAGTKQVDMADVYRRYFAGLAKGEFESAKVDVYEARFQWFALPALLLLLLEAVLRHPSRAAAILLAMFFSAGSMTGAGASETDGLAAYNDAVALYQQGEFETAATMFEQAAGSPRDDIAAAARYNLGTALYARVLESTRSPESVAAGNQGPPQNRPQSGDAADFSPDAPDPSLDPDETLGRSIAAFRAALQIRDPWPEARENLEQAVRLRERLRQQNREHSRQESDDENSEQKKDPQQQDPSERDQQDENGQQDSEPQDSEKKEGEQQDGQPQQPDDPQQQQDMQENQPQDQSPSSSETGQEKDDPSDASQQSEPSEPETEIASEQDASEQDASEQEVAPENADGQLSPASEQSAQDNQPSEEPPTERYSAMTPEEAQKMLQAIRDRDMIRRYRKAQLERSRRVTVDRDW